MTKNKFYLLVILLNIIGILITKYISFEAGGVYIAVIFTVFMFFWIASMFGKRD